MKKIICSLLAWTILIMSVTGCSNQSATTTVESGNQSSKIDTETASTTISETGVSSETESTSAISALLTTLGVESEIVVDTEFTARDLEIGYEESTATSVVLADNATTVSGNGAAVSGNVVTISSEGTYVISGTLSDGQIVIDVADTEKVQLVLDGVTLHAETSAPLYIKSADKVFITLKEGSVNTFTDGTEYVQTDDNNIDGVIFSKADVTFNGKGTLNITGSYKHGIVSKDDIVITGGTYTITAVKDAINGKDAVKIKDGILNLSAETGNGIQSKNADDTTKGYVYIAGGTITIPKCEEGLEGTAVIVENGTIDIKAADDGINAARGSNDDTTEQAMGVEGMNPFEQGENQQPVGNQEAGTISDSSTVIEEGDNPPWGTGGIDENGGEMPEPPSGERPNFEDGDFVPDGTMPENDGEERQNFGNFGNGFGGGMDEVDTNCYILIAGGNTTVDASGDGIDSNGNLYVTGGTLSVNGPTSGADGALDYNGTAEVTGGKVLVAGSSGMAQGFSDSSTQYSLLYSLSSVSTAGTEVILKDSTGAVVVSFTPTKDYQSVVISAPELTKDAVYTLVSGEQTNEVTLSSVVTSNGQQGMGRQSGAQPTR
ncbi:carbohydrate-binding domain-containing protein [Scatolibacter rhodanostii]|uniref:carbohydrate-binding domain-containing protein n=1 Tax=Scatolibacter rhodanostii TaxID=2014781 RepID=UPI000C080900|nr:carbohydrate-binding domain-containing protein [Scatolibacter rhodanostii]